MAAKSLTLKNRDKIFVGGAWHEPSTDRTFDVIASHDETVAYSVAEALEADVERAVSAAREAFDTGPWPRMSHAERADWMHKLAEALEERAGDFALGWTLESGVVQHHGAARMPGLLTGHLRTYADYADSFDFVERHRHVSGMEARLVHEPVGTVAAIIPWNGPAPLMIQKCAPALIAGCTIVIKPSPEAPSCGYLMGEVCEEIGFPAGVINMVVADRAASEALVRNPGIDKITFTGSTGAGRAIASACGERIARYTLELGGKSPAIILDDYDLDEAAKTLAQVCTFLSGQVCHSLTRLIVSRDRHDAFVEALAREVGKLRVGDPFAAETDVGPLATATQRDAVLSIIATAKSEGSELVIGGGVPDGLSRGFFVEPTVFANVDNRSTIGQQEAFGPVLAVIPVDSEEEAIAVANDTIYGLNSSVFTNDTEKFLSVASQIRAGTVGHNAPRTDSSISFGGFKQSGIGREGGAEGLLAFTESKLVVLDKPYD